MFSIFMYLYVIYKCGNWLILTNICNSIFIYQFYYIVEQGLNKY